MKIPYVTHLGMMIVLQVLTQFVLSIENMPEIVLMLNQKVLVRYLIFLMIIFLFIFSGPSLWKLCVPERQHNQACL